MNESSRHAPDRAVRLREVLDDCVRRRASGEVLSDQAILVAHPDLLPELEEQLRALALVEGALGRAAADPDLTISIPATARPSDSRAGHSICIRWSMASGADGNDYIVPQRLGSVRLGEEIGRGGMGVVFRGWDEMLGRTVAVKFLLSAQPDKSDPDFAQFLKGARAEAALRHPNIVTVYTAGVLDDVPYMVLDFIDGPTLRDVSRKMGKMPMEVAVKVMVEVSSAVAALHGNGIIHRDLKPGNVLFDRDGKVFVTDFGLALSLHRRERSPMLAGTPAYMAPECFAGKVTFQTDVYALGIMLYELQAGRLPFTGDVLQIRHQHEKEPLPLSGLAGRIPAEVIEVIERATHKNEIFRYKSAGHFQRALLGQVAENRLHQGDEVLAKMVIRVITEPIDATQATMVGEKGSSTYSELLAKLAARKHDEQRARPAIDSDSTHIGTLATELPVVAPQGFAHDIHCIKCGYNLRGLEQSGLCPECAEPITSTFRPDRLLFADPRWLARIARGLTLMSRTFLGASIILILALAGIAGIRFMTPGGTLLNDLGNLFIGFGFALGLWWSTSPEPNAPKRTRPEHLRRAARALAFTAFAVVLTMWFSGLFSHGLSVWFVSSQLMLEQIAGACAVLSLCGYLAAFAQRIPDRKLVLHTCWAAGIFGMALVSMGVLMAHTAWCSGGWPGHEGVIKLNHVVGYAYFILTLGAWLYGWHLVSLYRRAFRDALAHAVLLA